MKKNKSKKPKDYTVIDISVANGTLLKFWLPASKLLLNLLVFSFELKGKTTENKLASSQNYRKVPIFQLAIEITLQD